ncbi:MAG: hypothetical protein WC346_12710 [Methanogenium sp.]|jgi:hypothetical protein
MNTINEPISARAAAYCSIYPMLLQIAKDHGYTLCIHGSLHRDMDLVAVPWIEEASDETKLILSMKEAIGAVFHSESTDHLLLDIKYTAKPHGRKSYSLHLSNEGMYKGYIDISVMPRK